MTERTLDAILTDGQTALIGAKDRIAKHVEFLQEGSKSAQNKNDARLIGKALAKARRLEAKLQDYHNDCLDAVDKLDQPLGDFMAARR